MTHCRDLAAALALLGSLDEARAAAQAGLALDPGFTLRRLGSLGARNNPTFLASGMASLEACAWRGGASVRFGSIVLKKSKIERLRKSREGRVLVLSAALTRPNDMGTGSDPDFLPQLTVKALGYFGKT